MAEVRPKEWILPNRAGFLNWIYQTFHPRRYGVGEEPEAEAEGTKGTARRVHAMFPHQRFIRDYLQIQSPYRGMLLYHGLGTGKSATSIAAAEGYVSRHKRVYVLLPASLQPNYMKELRRFSRTGSLRNRPWVLIDTGIRPRQGVEQANEEAARFSMSGAFVKRENGRIWVPLEAVPEDLGTAQMLREGVAWKDMAPDDRDAAMRSLDEILRHKYHFISYNGISMKAVKDMPRDAFDNAFVVIDEAHNFVGSVANGSPVRGEIYKRLMNARGTKLVLLSGTPMINHPFELAVMLNLVRGPMSLYRGQVRGGRGSSSSSDAAAAPGPVQMPAFSDVERGLEGADLLKYVDYLSVAPDKREIAFTMMPWGYVRAKEAPFVRPDVWSLSAQKMAEHIHDHLRKLWGVKARLGREDCYALPASREEFDREFLDQTDLDDPKVRQQDLFVRRILGTVSYFRTAGEEYFPAELPRVLWELPMAEHQFNEYVSIRDKERKMEMRKGPAQGGLLDNKGGVYRAFSRMACNFVFPEGVVRPFPQDIRKAVKEMDMGEDSEEDAAPAPAQASATSAATATAPARTSAAARASAATATAAAPAPVRTSAPARTSAAARASAATATAPTQNAGAPDVASIYEKQIEDAMRAITRDASKTLSKASLASKLSPKMAQMLTDIEDSPGISLVYSQFRTVEGIGVFRDVLNANGFAELSVERLPNTNTWRFAGAGFDKAMDGRRYIVFDADREKTELLLYILNGMWTNIPSSLQEELAAAGYTDNLRGQVARVLMITQSGAEGISLRNVRRVLIMEPFWNMVRINQVIGRAIRTNSHMDLPPEDRNVQVFQYIATFTAKQLKDQFTIQTQDKGLTTDQHIQQVAEKKDAIIQEFLSLLKMAAVDCRLNARLNRQTCFAFPVNMDADAPATMPSWKDEAPIVSRKRMERAKKIRGQILTYKGYRMVSVPDMPGYYDYDAYKHAGVLVPMTPEILEGPPPEPTRRAFGSPISQEPVASAGPSASKKTTAATPAASAGPSVPSTKPPAPKRTPAASVPSTKPPAPKRTPAASVPPPPEPTRNAFGSSISQEPAASAGPSASKKPPAPKRTPAATPTASVPSTKPPAAERTPAVPPPPAATPAASVPSTKLPAPKRTPAATPAASVPSTKPPAPERTPAVPPPPAATPAASVPSTKPPAPKRTKPAAA